MWSSVDGAGLTCKQHCELVVFSQSAQLCFKCYYHLHHAHISDGLMWWFLKIRWEVEEKLAKVPDDDSDEVSDKKKWPSFVSFLCIQCTTRYKSILSLQWKRLLIILLRGSKLSNSLFCTLHCTCKHLTDTALALANLKTFNSKWLPFVMKWCWWL